MKSKGLMLSYIQVLYYFFSRSGTNHFKASVRPHTAYVDLTAEDCDQLPDVVHLDDTDSGKKVGIKKMIVNSTHFPLYQGLIITSSATQYFYFY